MEGIDDLLNNSHERVVRGLEAERSKGIVLQKISLSKRARPASAPVQQPRPPAATSSPNVSQQHTITVCMYALQTVHCMFLW